MDAWSIGLICNATMTLAYLLIAMAIVVPLSRSRQLRTNPLGTATALIFLSCAVHHGILAAQLIWPTLQASDAQGAAMRESWTWSLSLWDVVGMGIAVYYWGLRKNYASLMEGAQLFQDLREREQRALEINDTVLQGLVVARMALDLDDPQRAHDSLVASIDSASQIITDLLGNNPYHSLTLTRAGAATVAQVSDAPSPGSDAAQD